MQKHTPSSPINVTLSKMISKWSDTEGPVTVTFIFSGLEFQKGNGVRTKLIVKTRNVTGDIFAKPALLDCFGEKVDSAIFTFYTDGLSLCELCSLTEAISSLATTERYLPFKMTWTLTATITACLLQSSQGDTHRYLVAKTKNPLFYSRGGDPRRVWRGVLSLRRSRPNQRMEGQAILPRKPLPLLLPRGLRRPLLHLQVESDHRAFKIANLAPFITSVEAKNPALLNSENHDVAFKKKSRNEKFIILHTPNRTIFF